MRRVLFFPLVVVWIMVAAIPDVLGGLRDIWKELA